LVRTLFEDHYDSIWRLLRRFGVPASQADDAAQQVFLVLAERIADVRAGSERAFLFGTALRVATGLRRVARREVPTENADEESSTLPRPDELMDQKRARDALDGVLQQMAGDLRSVFILYELEGFTTPEIADMVEVPLGTAASRLRRAREQFRELVATLSTGNRSGGGRT
jgi:RNA polymerase sigma-70 factor (ECF subfamily)